jgi:demethylmenaquinone methyltransferase / 2-methoxy-6-polyprenyl-1,4-benzoquinol methylase
MNKPPVQQNPGRKEQVKGMFNSIAGRYDFLNHFLSVGVDYYWRKRLVKILSKDRPSEILDLATGTADLAIAAMKVNPEHVTGTDISEAMLAIGNEKILKLGLAEKINLLQADSENLPFENGRFDAAMVAFGVRNYEDLPKGLSEMSRVLKPGGKAIILEFAKPTKAPFKYLFSFYFRFILPLIGRLVSKHSSAYSYLPESVELVPQGKDFLDLMEQNGFRNVKSVSLTFGIAMLYIGTK